MGNIFRNLNFGELNNILLRIVPALICITIHELAHGFAAYQLGDMTAKNQGRLTLNPIKHIDPIGLLMMALVRFGWAKPVPVDMRNFKNPKRGMAVTALAGPASNFILAFVLMVISAVTYRFMPGSAARLIFQTAGMSISLAVFNLLPIPPLDGSKILFSFLPDRVYGQLMRYERYGFILLIALIYTDVFSGFLVGAVEEIYNAMADIVRVLARL